MINPDTGNCINEASVGNTTVKTCPEGQYLNPETNRCKKVKTTTQKECAEGYERNPDTGRCRKIVTATAIPEEGTHESPKIFIAVAGLILLGTITLAVVAYQFRQEITKFVRRILPRNIQHPSRVKLLLWRLRKS